MPDLSKTIVPKSDQLNSDDLIAGPRTFTVTEVRVKSTPEQPVDIHLAESPGKPFRPSKTVLRILVTAWGKEGDDYVGRRMTLYRDPEVRWAGQEVGGIRVSELSHISKPIKLALTETRGKKATHTIKPIPKSDVAATTLPVDPPGGPITDAQSKQLHGLLKGAGIEDRDLALAYIGDILGRDVDVWGSITKVEAAKVIEQMAAKPAEDPPAESDDWPTPAAIPGTEG